MAILLNLVDMFIVNMTNIILAFCCIVMGLSLWRMWYLSKRVECLQHKLLSPMNDAEPIHQPVAATPLYCPHYIAANIDRHIDLLQQKTSELTQKLSSHYQTEASFSIALEKLPAVNTLGSDTIDKVDNNTRYDQAREYLAQGYAVDDIVKNIGLSRTEVSLIHALSKQKNTLNQGFSEKV